MKFFTDEKFARGLSHTEYERYWLDNRDNLPAELLRMNGGMLPDSMLADTHDPICLHDARIQEQHFENGNLTILLHGDHNGALRQILLQYINADVEFPISASLTKNTSDCDLLCHELTIDPDGRFDHRMMFANSEIVALKFTAIEIGVQDDGIAGQ